MPVPPSIKCKCTRTVPFTPPGTGSPRKVLRADMITRRQNPIVLPASAPPGSDGPQRVDWPLEPRNLLRIDASRPSVTADQVTNLDYLQTKAQIRWEEPEAGFGTSGHGPAMFVERPILTVSVYEWGTNNLISSSTVASTDNSDLVWEFEYVSGRRYEFVAKAVYEVPGHRCNYEYNYYESGQINFEYTELAAPSSPWDITLTSPEMDSGDPDKPIPWPWPSYIVEATLTQSSPVQGSWSAEMFFFPTRNAIALLQGSVQGQTQLVAASGQPSTYQSWVYDVNDIAKSGEVRYRTVCLINAQLGPPIKVYFNFDLENPGVPSPPVVAADGVLYREEVPAEFFTHRGTDNNRLSLKEITYGGYGTLTSTYFSIGSVVSTPAAVPYASATSADAAFIQGTGDSQVYIFKQGIDFTVDGTWTTAPPLDTWAKKYRDGPYPALKTAAMSWTQSMSQIDGQTIRVDPIDPGLSAWITISARPDPSDNAKIQWAAKTATFLAPYVGPSSYYANKVTDASGKLSRSWESCMVLERGAATLYSVDAEYAWGGLLFSTIVIGDSEKHRLMRTDLTKLNTTFPGDNNEYLCFQEDATSTQLNPALILPPASSVSAADYSYGQIIWKIGFKGGETQTHSAFPRAGDISDFSGGPLAKGSTLLHAVSNTVQGVYREYGGTVPNKDAAGSPDVTWGQAPVTSSVSVPDGQVWIGRITVDVGKGEVDEQITAIANFVWRPADALGKGVGYVIDVDSPWFNMEISGVWDGIKQECWTPATGRMALTASSPNLAGQISAVNLGIGTADGQHFVVPNANITVGGNAASAHPIPFPADVAPSSPFSVLPFIVTNTSNSAIGGLATFSCAYAFDDVDVRVLSGAKDGSNIQQLGGVQMMPWPAANLAEAQVVHPPRTTMVLPGTGVKGTVSYNTDLTPKTKVTQTDQPFPSIVSFAVFTIVTAPDVFGSTPNLVDAGSSYLAYMQDSSGGTVSRVTATPVTGAMIFDRYGRRLSSLSSGPSKWNYGEVFPRRFPGTFVNMKPDEYVNGSSVTPPTGRVWDHPFAQALPANVDSEIKSRFTTQGNAIPIGSTAGGNTFAEGVWSQAQPTASALDIFDATLALPPCNVPSNEISQWRTLASFLTTTPLQKAALDDAASGFNPVGGTLKLYDIAGQFGTMSQPGGFDGGLACFPPFGKATSYTRQPTGIGFTVKYGVPQSSQAPTQAVYVPGPSLVLMNTPEPFSEATAFDETTHRQLNAIDGWTVSTGGSPPTTSSLVSSFILGPFYGPLLTENPNNTCVPQAVTNQGSSTSVGALDQLATYYTSISQSTDPTPRIELTFPSVSGINAIVGTKASISPQTAENWIGVFNAAMSTQSADQTKYTVGYELNTFKTAPWNGGAITWSVDGWVDAGGGQGYMGGAQINTQQGLTESYPMADPTTNLTAVPNKSILSSPGPYVWSNFFLPDGMVQGLTSSWPPGYQGRCWGGTATDRSDVCVTSLWSPIMVSSCLSTGKRLTLEAPAGQQEPLSNSSGAAISWSKAITEVTNDPGGSVGVKVQWVACSKDGSAQGSAAIPLAKADAFSDFAAAANTVDSRWSTATTPLMPS